MTASGFFGGGGGSGGGGITPLVTTVLGPATGTFTDVTGTYAIPATATMITVEVQAGGGGGASGSTLLSSGTTTGAGGGGGGGRSLKTVPAALLRTAFPSGIPYTVGHGGAGAPTTATTNTAGSNGTAGGFTFAGDFIVATPGNLYQVSQGGAPNGTAFGGSAGYGDMLGCSGGWGGGAAQFLIQGGSLTSYQGGNGGFPAGYFGQNNTNIVAYTQGGGGGGGGGGGAGIAGSTAYNGGNSGFAITTDVSPNIAGAGGIVGGAAPTAASAPSVLVSTQGGGGGGASSLAGAGQAGASALVNSGSGGGGGGAGATSGGAGGNGGSGWIRFIAW